MDDLAAAASGSAYESEVWADLDAVRSSLGWEGYLSCVTVRLVSASAYDGFAIALSSDKRQGLSVERELAYDEKLSRFLSRALAGLKTLVSFIFSFGAMLGAAITMYAAVSQRRRELGVLRAILFRRAHILLGMLVETAMVGLLGAAAGVALALLTPLLEFSTANWATGQELTFRFVPGGDPSVRLRPVRDRGGAARRSVSRPARRAHGPSRCDAGGRRRHASRRRR